MGNICPYIICGVNREKANEKNINNMSDANTMNNISDEEIINYLAQLGSLPLPKDSRTVASLGSHGINNFPGSGKNPPEENSPYGNGLREIYIQPSPNPPNPANSSNSPVQNLSNAPKSDTPRGNTLCANWIVTDCVKPRNGNTVQMTQVNHIRNPKDNYPTDDFVLVKQL